MLLKKLFVFYELQFYKSFREAALALKIPESSIRTIVTGLEQEFGSLLVRTDEKGYQFTESGERILEHISQLRQKNQELYCLKDAATQMFSQRISLAANTQCGSLMFTEILAEILQKYPAAKFFLRTTNSHELVQLLQAKQIDLALLQVTRLEQSALWNQLRRQPLQIDNLYQDQMCFLVGPQHPFYEQDSVKLKEMLQCSRLVSKNSMDELTYTFFKNWGYHDKILQIQNIMLQRNLIRETNFVSWQSLQAAKSSLQLYKDELHIVKILDFDWSSVTYVIYKKTSSFSEKLLLEYVQQKFLTM